MKNKDNHFIVEADEEYIAWDNSHVEARGNSRVEARDNSHVEARDNSHVVAWENSHVVARENSHVVARENSHVVARENSHVELYDFSVCHKMFHTVIVKNISPKSVVITVDYPTEVVEWVALKGINIENNRIHLYKCVNKDGTDFRTGKINYLSDEEIVAPDWDEDFKGECGFGLHLADSIESAKFFVMGKDFRLLMVSVDINDCRVFGGRPMYSMKLRARACIFEKEILSV